MEQDHDTIWEFECMQIAVEKRKSSPMILGGLRAIREENQRTRPKYLQP